MTDDTTTRTAPTSMDEASGETSTGSAGSTSTAGDTYAWTEPEPHASSDRGEKAREWLAQLQAMIEQLATQAAPVIREVGAKAAELTAVAGEKAGPVAARTAEVTGEAGHKLAERARALAAELRRDQAGSDATSPRATGSSETMGDTTSSTVETEEDRPAGVS